MNPLSFDIEAPKPKIGRTFYKRLAHQGEAGRMASPSDIIDRDRLSERL